MQGNLTWTIKLLHVAVEGNIQHLVFGNDAISSTQAMVLHFLYSLDNSESYAANLCSVMGISSVTISTALKDLRKKGYLKVFADAADDRRKKIVLTPKAFGAQKAIEKHLQMQQALLCRNIPAEHLLWLENDLQTMIQNTKTQRQEESTYAENASGADKAI